MALYDEAGTVIEGALTPSEAKALEEQKSQELIKAREELKAREEELTKLREKDLNFSHLRSQKEEAEKKAETLKSEIEVKIEQVKKEVVDGVLKEHYGDALSNLASGDEELKKKIEFHYNRLNDPTSSKTEIDKKLRDAWSMAQERPSTFTNAFASSGSVSMMKPSSSGSKFTDEEKKFAQRFASAGGLVLKDEDFK